ncbi:M1 family metallopeptidase [Acanthopleuribacter pedis]|uniref:M1 family metallopeptidase n=1 Tax=Acanthopleuribacter pedis TaxID=442870 RepID=A0A8J7Q3U7_9BACT|nr:M1 family metallopeptidase [Acanthopleuribacter pedis]MBO1317844.1 M1 family metallopeptidase [Acanthopleuribacter pedis]
MIHLFSRLSRRGLLPSAMLIALLVACGTPETASEIAAPTPTQTGEAALMRQRNLMATLLPEKMADQPPTDYQIEVSLDAEGRRLIGTQTLVYQNQSGDILDRLPFHLYLNAFRDDQSVMAKSLRTQSNAAPHTGGSMTLERFTIDGTPVLDQVHYPHEPDQTVAVFPLAQPLFPGESVTVRCDFTAQLPEDGLRSLAVDDFFFVAQWFPKIGVWESSQQRDGGEPGWVCPPYHALTEFYADFGHYQVSLDVPADFEVGATGVLVDERREGDGTRKQLTFRAEMVHDFAWSASPHFLRATRTFEMTQAERLADQARFGLDEEQSELPPVEMVLLIQPQHEHQIERHFEAMRHAIRQTGMRLGPYPYPVITMVDPVYAAFGACCMEYPMLVSLNTHWSAPAEDYELEDLIFHEYIHQYFQGLVATNEFTSAWLDEGFTSYLTAKLVYDQYGPSYTPYRPLFLYHVPTWWWLGFAPFHPMEAQRRHALVLRRGARVDQAGPEFFSSSDYELSVYDRTALMLFQLERLLGEETMAGLMRAWFTEYRFRHPDTDDFVRFAQAFCACDLRVFFEDWLHGEGFLDYAVEEVRTRHVPEPPADGGHTEYYRVTLVNHGNLRLPLTITLHFEDGSVKTESWQGEEARGLLEGYAASPLVQVVLDPEGRLLLDRYRGNHVWRARADHRGADAVAQKTTNALQHWLQLLAGAVL